MKKTAWPYSPEYVDPIDVQRERLRNWFLSNAFPKKTNQEDTQKEHPGADGTFLVPSWHLVSSSYREAVRIALNALSSSMDNFENHLKDDIEYLEQNKREYWLPDDSVGLIRHTGLLRVQTGKRYLGLSSKKARMHFGFGERGLGLFDATCIILGNPRRFSRSEDVGIICLRDKMLTVSNTQEVHERIPFYYFKKGELFLGWVYDDSEIYGAVASEFFDPVG